MKGPCNYHVLPKLFVFVVLAEEAECSAIVGPSGSGSGSGSLDDEDLDQSGCAVGSADCKFLDPSTKQKMEICVQTLRAKINRQPSSPTISSLRGMVTGAVELEGYSSALANPGVAAAISLCILLSCIVIVFIAIVLYFRRRLSDQVRFVNLRHRSTSSRTSWKSPEPTFV